MAKSRQPEVDLEKLCDAIRASRMVLEPFRVARREAVRKYAGDQWSTETAFVPRPINFLSLYLQIMSKSLIAHDPRATLKTFNKQYRAVVSAEEDWINPEIKRMKLADTLERAGIDALYGFSVVKVALVQPTMSEKSGWEMQVGQPGAWTIDLDDWAMDPHARDLRELSWCGHRSRVRTESLKDSKLYEAAKRKHIKSNPDRQFNEDGDERIAMLQRQYVTGDWASEAYEYTDVWEIYLPMEKLIVTMLSDDGGSPELIEMRGENVAFDVKEWVGPYCGPYHYLNLMPPVSGNAINKGPIQDLIQMDEHLNGIMTKLIRQAARQKEILLYGGASEDDVQRITDTQDGGTARCDSPEKIKPMGFGGPAPNNHNFMMGMWEMLNKLGGNIELIGGLGEQSKTATQDKMLNANASSSMKWMQQAMVKFTSEVFDSLLWFHHHHPVNKMKSYREIPGLPAPIERVVTPADRYQVPYEEIIRQIDPYSLQHQTPGERLAFLNQVVTQTLIPMMPLLKEQGIGINIAKFLELVAEYGNSPDLTEIITNLAEASPEEGGEEEGPGKPAQTQRTYNRVNASTQTGEGQVKANLQQMMGTPRGGRPSNNGTYTPVSAQ